MISPSKNMGINCFERISFTILPPFYNLNFFIMQRRISHSLTHSFGLAMLMLFALFSCQKEETAIAPEAGVPEASLARAGTPPTSAPRSGQEGTCQCEYQILEDDITAPTANTPGHGEYILYLPYTGFLCNDNSNCTYMYALKNGICKGNLTNPNCTDIITTMPPTQFLPFNCEVPTFSTFDFRFESFWFESGCAGFLPPATTYVKFRIRCSDQSTSEGCPGQSYYSPDIEMVLIGETLQNPAPQVSLTGCGCTPAIRN
ncbi:MAG: hypothetical protein IPN76_18080 [Saprospiraceae bacterium]|nr:hypothetical protein [Saprospiraceae bacterium]